MTLSQLLAQKGQGLARQLDGALPALLVANDGHLWHWSRPRYVLDFPALAWDVDDVAGFLWAVDLDRQLLFYDPTSDRWNRTSIAKVRDFQATDRIIYFLQMDGALMARSKGQAKTISRILERTVQNGTLLGTRGKLYLLEGGHLYRYDQGRWDKSATPIQSEVRAVVADGRDYYALNQAGQVYSGVEERMLDTENRFAGLWLIGKNLLALTRSKQVFGYTAATKTWQRLR
jgi:hypothetical protein